MRFPPGLLRAMKVCVAVTLLVILWRAADGQQAMRLLAGAEVGWIAAAFLALTAQTILSAMRWRITARQLGQTIPLGLAIREYYLAQVVNQSLPGGVLGDASRAVRARKGAGLTRSVQAVLFERLAGQVVLFAVMLAAMAAVTLAPGGLSLPDWIVIPVVTALAGFAVVALAVWALSRLPGHPGASLRGTGRAFRQAVLHPRVLPVQAGLSLATTALNLLAFALCARATGIPLSPGATMVVVPLILTTMLVPLSVGGWGLREGSAALLLPLVGAGQAAGFAASVAFGLVFLASTLPGLVVLLFKDGMTLPNLPGDAAAQRIPAREVVPRASMFRLVPKWR